MARPTTTRRGASGEGGGAAERRVPGPARATGARRRLPEDRERRTTRRRTLLATLVGAVLVTGFALWAFYGSSWLRVERVRVHGAGVLTADEVRRAAAVPRGTALAAVDRDAVAGRVRAALRRVRSVRVTRSWPRTLAVTVVERTPVLLVRRGGGYGETDRDGVLFATVDRAPKGVPSLRMEAADSASTRRFGLPRLRQEAVRIVRDLPARVRAETGEVRVRGYDDVVLTLRDGRTVVWGSEEQGRAKAVVLTALMKAAHSAHHFDVSAPTAPAASGS